MKDNRKQRNGVDMTLDDQSVDTQTSSASSRSTDDRKSLINQCAFSETEMTTMKHQ